MDRDACLANTCGDARTRDCLADDWTNNLSTGELELTSVRVVIDVLEVNAKSWAIRWIGESKSIVILNKGRGCGTSLGSGPSPDDTASKVTFRYPKLPCSLLRYRIAGSRWYAGSDYLRMPYDTL